jgi:hypothetical protein
MHDITNTTGFILGLVSNLSRISMHPATNEFSLFLYDAHKSGFPIFLFMGKIRNGGSPSIQPGT